MRITNPDSLNQYRAKAADALAKHGGAVVHASPEIKVLEGKPIVPDMMALLQFPDRAAAESWAEDPDLQDVHALRQNSGSTEILLF